MVLDVPALRASHEANSSTSHVCGLRFLQNRAYRRKSFAV